MNKKILNPGIVLGVAVVLFSVLTLVLGWYKNPSMGPMTILILIAIEVVVLVWGLRGTAVERGYGGQVVAGLLMALIGAVIIFIGSVIFTPMLAPDYPAIAEAQMIDQLAAQGSTDEEIEPIVEATAFTRTPVFGAFMGAFMTVLTGLVISLIAAAFVRKKD